MNPLAECLDLIQGKSPDEYAREHPHPVLIGLGAIAGELQRNPTKAAGTMFLSLSAAPGGADQGQLVNQVFSIVKVATATPADGIFLGSGPENDLVIPDSSISKSHAHLVLNGESCSLVDHGSTNGSFVNGSRVESGPPLLLKGGDILTIGRFSFTYYDALSFAKLLFVQALARGRTRTMPRTPGGPRATAIPATPGRGVATPGGPSQPRISPPPAGTSGPSAPWAQPNSGSSGQLPPQGGPFPDASPPWKPGAPTRQDWQQQAIGRPPPATNPSSPPIRQGMPTRPTTQVTPVQPPAEATSWVGRQFSRFSSWLRRILGT